MPATSVTTAIVIQLLPSPLPALLLPPAPRVVGGAEGDGIVVGVGIGDGEGGGDGGSAGGGGEGGGGATAIATLWHSATSGMLTTETLTPRAACASAELILARSVLQPDRNLANYTL